MAVGPVIIAIGVASDIASRLGAGVLGHIGIAIGVAVKVSIPGRGIGSSGFVDYTITVVVDSIAVLSGTWIGPTGTIITIGIIRDIARGLITGDLGNCAISIGVPVSIHKRVVGCSIRARERQRFVLTVL